MNGALARILHAVRARPHRTLYWVLLGAFVLISFQGLGALFLVGHEANGGAQRSIIARNYLRYGLIETGGKPLVDPGFIAVKARRAVHWHHPPGANLLVGLSFRIFGESEAAARLVPVLLGILAFWLLHRHVEERYGPTEALVASAIYAFLPLRLTYGNMVNYEVPITAFVLLALYLLRRLAVAERRVFLLSAGVVASLAAAIFIDWPACIFAALVGVVSVATKPRRPVLFVVIGVVSAAVLVGVFFWVSQGYREQLVQMAKFRSGSTTYGATGFGEFFERMVFYADLGFGPIVLLSATLLIAVELASFRLDPVVAVLGIGSLLYLTAFRQAATKHEFYLFFLAPALAVASGVGLSRLARGLAGRTRVGFLAGLAFCVLLGDVPRLSDADDRTNGVVPPRSRQPSATQARDQVTIAQLIASKSKRTDLVQVHTSVPESLPFDYYLGLNSRRSSTSQPMKGARWFIAKDGALGADAQRKLAETRPVIVALGYVVFELEGKGPRVTAYKLAESKPSIFWQYAVSWHYSPGRLVPDPRAVAQFGARGKPASGHAPAPVPPPAPVAPLAPSASASASAAGPAGSHPPAVARPTPTAPSSGARLAAPAASVPPRPAPAASGR